VRGGSERGGIKVRKEKVEKIKFLNRAVYNGMDVALKYYPLGDREWATSQWRNLFSLNEWRKEIGTKIGPPIQTIGN
jgi:hypothetical protein